MLVLPPSIKKSLLISGLLHLSLIMLLQIFLVHKGGMLLFPEDVAPPTLAVSIRHLSSKYIKSVPLAPAPRHAPEPTAPNPPPVPVVIADPAPAFGLEFFDPPPYLPVEELTEKPKVIKDMPPEAPKAFGMQAEGTVIMRLLINELGEIDDVVIEETSIAVVELQTVMNLARRMTFSPGIKDGTAVKSEFRIEVKIEKPPARRVLKSTS